MSQIENRPNEILHVYQEFWRAPESLLPSWEFAEQMSKTVQDIVAAQISWAQAVMSVNARLMEFWLPKTNEAGPVHAGN